MVARFTGRWRRIFIAGVASAALLVLLAGGAGSAIAGSAPSVPIAELTLTGANEVPPVTVNAVGYFSGTIYSDHLAYDLSADGDMFTMAHIHVGAPGTNGPVVAFLFGPDMTGVNALHTTGTITVANLVGPLKGDWAGFAKAMAAGDLYVNVHSIANPGGTIRVWIPKTTPPAVATPVAPGTGSGAATSGAGLNGTWTLALGLLAALMMVAGGAVFAAGIARRD